MHLLRRDLWTNFIAQAACAVYWFHPLVWILARTLHHDQEEACDDAVLSAGFEPATYAQALLAVAQTVTPNLLYGCPMTTQTNLKTRIARLLDGRIARTTSRARLFRTAAVFAILIAAIAALTPLNADEVYKVGGDVLSPKVIYHVDPQYTEEARQAKISGTVVLLVVVGTDGLAHDVNVQRSLDPGLDRNAAVALEQWRFAPGTRQGVPVAVRAVIEINYRLQ
jgi:TonB family protein